jgi:hypothetical protein
MRRAFYKRNSTEELDGIPGYAKSISSIGTHEGIERGDKGPPRTQRATYIEKAARLLLE